MEDFIYVLVENNVYDKTNYNEQEVQVFKNLEDANRELIKLKSIFEYDNAKELKNMVVEEDIYEEDIESSMFSYCAYENGNYNNNHYELTIYQRDLD